ncbi:hypothetical protein C2869_03720 [Saccharobesus litoralis]|uniref:CBM6 domain-containing protein n=1 Tax=Saccharobesus litoralis TaxID=2172099 RepID=A0A2S0VN04_9ALTE|nr:family 43 glycosylhydrolase [Saccharobesus litoralis]AWB65597.1 hypothetical protein C2869_03720 [Saccharobesus litoralis]
MKKLSSCLLTAVLVTPIHLTWAKNKQNINTAPYPFGNPIISHMYTADAAPKVMPDGRVWMVTSVDHEHKKGYHNMEALHAFSTADMKHWVDHGTILHTEDMPEPQGQDWAIWAPDVVYRNGTYYIYYPMRNYLDAKKQRKGGVDRYVAIATSERMNKKFDITVERMKGITRAGLDPSVFIDDDGSAYLYWNQALMAKLRDDMLGLDGKMFKLDYGSDNFMEAAWMHKRRGKYYYNYHTKYNGKVDRNNPDDPARKKSHLDYSMGDSPIGPLKYMGTINYELGSNISENFAPKFPGKDYVPWRLTQSNHGAVLEYHGQEYFFYHTSAVSSWRQDKFKAEGTWTQRSVAVDYLNYNEDGSAIPVKQTLTGVDAVKIAQPFSIKPKLDNSEQGLLTAKNGDVVKFNKLDLGTGYYYFGMTVHKTVSNGHIEVRRDSPDGMLMGTLLLRDNSMIINNARTETFLREAYGNNRDVYLLFKLATGDSVTVSAPDFFAGSPLPVPGDKR